jgi:hypothetical protein
MSKKEDPLEVEEQVTSLFHEQPQNFLVLSTPLVVDDSSQPT